VNNKVTNESWQSLLVFIKQLTGKKPTDINAVLYLIGVQELGKGPMVFSKEEKQDLMHIATCKVLSLGGYFEFKGHDAQGWPHWESSSTIPFMDLKSQEEVLKHFILEYFKLEVGLHI
jgi:hypothetical protein